jgi:glucose/arabinose dehydrogenase
MVRVRNVSMSAAALAALAGLACAQSLPPNFAEQVIVPDFDQATGVLFAPDGRGFVWEKAGKVWLVENGVRSAQPLIDISQEVGNWSDYGLLGFAIDPNFYTNGYIYLLYVVDYHHLKFFGTPQYNANTSTEFHDTIGRLTRYTATAASGYRTVDYGTRLVLLGESITTGFPITHTSHGPGTVLFGEDGSLLVSCGDGASYINVSVGGAQSGSSNTALADGIITQTEDVGAYRAQLVNSLSGKVLRLDPATGNGLATNPFYNAAAPRSPRSRVWAMGMRNPFRFGLRPGTGTPGLSSGDPGTLYVVDVGWNAHESLGITQGPGANFGWPAFEGLDVEEQYWDASPVNRDAPNPLAGGSCPAFFKFRDLIIPPTLGTPSWPNPCNLAQQVPASIPTFVHKFPVIEWGHGRSVRVPTFQGGVFTPVNITSAQSPVPGYQFGGSAGIGAAWYSGSLFPPAYNNTFFMGDYSSKFINNLVFDAADNLVEARPFAEDCGGVVCVAVNPVDQSLYYIRFDETGPASLRRIYWTSNLPPVAAAGAVPTFGPAPLTVTFSSAGSLDPEGQPLTYLWDFGDGSPRSTAANPVHTYQAVEDITAQGTIVARLFSLNPPTPLGEGNPNPQVIRDGIFPPVGSDDPMTQYDTSHNGEQGSDDWIGYTFPSSRQMRRLVFQEGMEFAEYGGWLDVINVEYRTGSTWTPVTGLTIDPVYAGHDSVNFNTYIIGFNPVNATGLRVRGQPGGVTQFFSVGELRVFATPTSPSTAPTSHTVTLTVRDNLNASAQTTLLVSPNNTPPQVTITSPVNNAIYPVGPNLNVQLRATIGDAETPAQLTCRWQAIFHHDTHTHGEPPIFECAPDVSVPSGGCDAEYFWEFKLTVKDPQGLETTRSVFMYPDCSCYPNCDASTVPPVLTPNDFLCFFNQFVAGEEHYANCDGSTVAPVLTANDFLCYINRYVAGCS